MWNEIRSSQSLHISCENILRFKTEKLYLCSSFHVFVVKCVGWVPVAVSQSPHNLSAISSNSSSSSSSSLLLQPGALQVHVDLGVDVRHFYDYSCGNAPHQHLGLHGFGLWLVWIVSVSQSLKKIHNFNVELSWCRYYHHYI